VTAISVETYLKIGALYALAVCILNLVVSPLVGDLGWGLGISAIAVTIGLVIKSKYQVKLLNDLSYAMPRRYSVQMNGVDSGDLSEKELLEIKLSVLNDPDTYYKQLINLSQVAWSIGTHLVSGIPVVCFWTIIVYSLLYPVDLTLAIESIKSANDLKLLVQSMLLIATPVLILVYALFISTGINKFGSKSIYVESLSTKIRHRLGISATGKLTFEEIPPLMEVSSIRY
jgi:hypothetical protein